MSRIVELEAVMTVTIPLEVAETSINLMVVRCKLCKRQFSLFSYVRCGFGYLEKCLNLFLDFASETGKIQGVPVNRRENGARNHLAGSSASSGLLGRLPGLLRRQPPSNRFLPSCGLLVSNFRNNVQYFVLSQYLLCIAVIFQALKSRKHQRPPVMQLLCLRCLFLRINQLGLALTLGKELWLKL